MELSTALKHRLNAGRVATWIMKLPSGSLEFDELKAVQLGYDPKDFNHYSHFTALIHPDDYEATMQHMRDHLEGRSGRYHCSYRIKDSDGDYHIYMDQGTIVEKHGDNITLIGATVDVT